jgi:hypothetical protein
MSNKINDERLEDLQVYLGDNNLTLDNVRLSPTKGYYAFKDVDDDEGQTIGVKVYELPQEVKDTLNLIRNIEVEEITNEYPVIN